MKDFLEITKFVATVGIIITIVYGLPVLALLLTIKWLFF